MDDFNKLLQRDCPLTDGIYDCRGQDFLSDVVKRTDSVTYSERAAAFTAQDMLKLGAEEEKLLAPLAAVPKHEYVLELAGGNGRFALYLLKQGHRVIESDLARGSVAKVRETALAQGLDQGTYALIDAENLPFKDGGLGAVFMVASLHHLPTPTRAIAEIARVLKPGGSLLILREPASWQYYVFFPLFWCLRKILRQRNRNAFSLADDLTWGFSKRGLKKMLRDGFTGIRIEPVHYLRKFYANWLILSKKFGWQAEADQKIVARLKRIDAVIARLPLVNLFPWDWDVFAEKNISPAKATEANS